MRTKHQHTIAELVIEKCGGAQAVAKLLGIDVASVHKWKYPGSRGGTNGLVPAARQQELMDRAKEAGIDLSPSDFFATGSDRPPVRSDHGASA